MGKLKPMARKVFIVGPTESILTRRGNRHPALAKYLVDEGYELEYVTSDFYHAEKRWFDKKEVREAEERAQYKLTTLNCLGYKSNISVRRVLSNALLSLKVFVYLFPRLNKNTILILPSRPVETIFSAAALRLMRRTSVALDIQDIWPDMLVINNKWKSLVFSVYCNMYLKLSLRFIDKFFHVAPSFLLWLRRYAPRAESTFVPLGFDQERWAMIIPSEKKEITKPIRMVCVGLLQHQIDVMPVLQAISGRKDSHLTIIGDDGDGERYPEVLRYIEENSLTNVTLTGRVPPEEMASHLSKMDLGIVPMISSSIPNKVFDYIASYLPILVLGESDCARFVIEKQIGWSVPYNQEGVSSFLNEVCVSEIEKKALNISLIRQDYERANLFAKVKHLIGSKEVRAENEATNPAAEIR